MSNPYITLQYAKDKGYTHFVEQFANEKDRPKIIFALSYQEISDFTESLQMTKPPLYTAAVWLIKYKPSGIIAEYDPEINAIIIE